MTADRAQCGKCNRSYDSRVQAVSEIRVVLFELRFDVTRDFLGGFSLSLSGLL
jgi:hypothetical protein